VSRRRLSGIFAGIAAISLTVFEILTPARPQWAFYGPYARAWEFAAGGLVAQLPANWLTSGIGDQHVPGKLLGAISAGTLLASVIGLPVTPPPSACSP
jgi:peptidoglycan/LPS O-acetylase OafA/YrhL